MKIAASPNTLTGTQVRMARAGLRWSISETAKRAGIGESTVKAIEATDGRGEIAAGLAATREYRATARAEALAALWRAFHEAGVVFLEETPDHSVGTVVRIGKRRSKAL